MRKFLHSFLLVVASHLYGFSLSIPDSILNPLLAPFYYGVASGDPTQDRVMLWTHVTPDEPGPADVFWQVSKDSLFTQVLASGMATAFPEKDYTLKVDAGGLGANTWYFYRFNYKGRASITGRTRTMPDAVFNQMRFGVMTCADYKDGFFNAYARLVERNDMDAIIHLGDYIYESKSDPDDNLRPVLPDKRCATLDDYRTRYAFYRLDPYLREAHQQYPWFTVWDDHEFANDAWRDGSDRYSGAEWQEIKEIGLKTYGEWMPIRYPYDNDSLRIYRKISLGPTADLIMLDVRLVGRDEPLPFSNTAVNSSTRTMMGTEQKNWFKENIRNSTAQWKLVAQQNLMANYRVLGFPVPGTEKVWNNFPAERTEVLTFILDNNIKNTVVLTGDVHAAFVNDLPARASYNQNTGAGSAAVEFVTPSLTSGGEIDVPFNLLKSNNPYAFFADTRNRGYTILDVKPDTVSGNFYWTPYLIDSPTETFGGAYCTAKNTQHITNCQTERTKIEPPFPLAPTTPGTFITGINKTNSEKIEWIAFPNPTQDVLQVRLNIPRQQSNSIALTLLNSMGQAMRQAILTPGNHQCDFNLDGLPTGLYILQMQAGNQSGSLKVVKE